jgi:hypothetical protein
VLGDLEFARLCIESAPLLRISIEGLEERRQMESRLDLGTVLCVLLAIAYGVYCLYPSPMAHVPGPELHLGSSYQHGQVHAVNLSRNEATTRDKSSRYH